MSSSKFILFAEDDTDRIFLIKKACERANIPPEAYTIVPNGNAAVSYLQQSSSPVPSLIISDFRMPLLDGLELLEWVRKDSSVASIRFVLCSSLVTTSMTDRAHQLGCDLVCEKPADFSKMVSFVSEFYSMPDSQPGVTRTFHPAMLQDGSMGSFDSKNVTSSFGA